MNSTFAGNASLLPTWSGWLCVLMIVITGLSVTVLILSRIGWPQPASLVSTTTTPRSVMNGDLIIFERLMINGHAKRSADLVLPCVALSDIAAVVEEGAHSSRGLQALLDPLGHFHDIRLVAGERNDGDLDGR